jgi:hypothetical protein
MAFVLAGCATGPLSKKSNLDASSKQVGIVVACSGGYKTWADCNLSAAQACPKGYEVLSKEENLVMQGRSLRISCK